MSSRRKFLAGLLGAAASQQLLPRLALAESFQRGLKPIDRIALVKRHNPVSTKIDPLAPLSIGNGQFAFTADVTGLQTLPSEYVNAMPLCTMSQWGWHTKPRSPSLLNATLRLKSYDTHGRSVGYQTSSEGQSELFNWLRENPHRLSLAQIGFCRTASATKEIRPADISDIRQELDLWRGVITSRFNLDGQPVSVSSAVHPTVDLIAVSVESNLI